MPAPQELQFHGVRLPLPAHRRTLAADAHRHPAHGRHGGAAVEFDMVTLQLVGS